MIAPSGTDPALTRRLGQGLTWFGWAGVVLLIASAVAFAMTVRPLAETAGSLEDQRTQLVGLLGPAGDSLDSAAASADHGVASLVSSETAARNAATVTSQLASAMEGLGVFSPAFAETAAQSRSLSDNLIATADALHQNQIDSAGVATNLRALANQVKALRLSVGGSSTATGGGAVSTVGLPLLVALAVALLLWLGALAVGCIWVGRRLLRMTTP
jgi:hypothetical protein